MSRFIGASLLVLASLTFASIADAAAPPTGALPDLVRPTAYRLDFVVNPDAADFRGHTEIDAQLARATHEIFLHGKDLRVSRAVATAAGVQVVARYAQVDDSGVVRLELASELPAGPVTLRFDYRADFRTGAEGLYRAKVAGNWYVWSQGEPLDARRAFPGFDEPGFKTPFTVTVTAPRAMRAFTNTPETGLSSLGRMTVHRYAPTQPLPTYLVALGVGPFDVVEASIPPNAVRKQALPLRVIATKGQGERMQFALAEAPKLLGLLEDYLRIPYPFEKLDLLASPILGGAMENAALIGFDDSILLLDANAPQDQLRSFGEVVAHELAHQWFGDLVTPSWWVDIWLNESFAEWLGKKIGDRWRPDLGIATTLLTDAFYAMEMDALGGGRPMRQTITENRDVVSVFDSITYQKGAQVLSMVESYLGEEKFAQGIQLHLDRYQHGNASADDFFRSLSEAAADPKIIAAMRSFIDQTGVPLVTVTRAGQGLSLTQQRYRPLGIGPGTAQTWKIPLCVAAGGRRDCTLLENASGMLTASGAATGGTALMPNAAGAGYYRFRLDAGAWDALIETAPMLPAREALALADSVWADFAAGGSFARVLRTARLLGTNPDRLASLELAGRLQQLANTLLTPEQLPQYRRLMLSIYGPRLAAAGIELRAGAHAAEQASAQALRQSLLPVVALEGGDPELRARLATAAEAFLAGDTQAIDPAFRGTALRVAVQDRGVPFIDRLGAALAISGDPLFRAQAAASIGAADTPALARAALRVALAPGLQSYDIIEIVGGLARQPGARDTVASFVNANFKRVMKAYPGFARPTIVSIFEYGCAAEDVAKVRGYIEPKLAELGGGALELQRTTQRIELCVALKAAKGAEIAAAVSGL
jgi:aminopeptidase N